MFNCIPASLRSTRRTPGPPPPRSSVLCIRVFCQRLWRRLRRNVWKSTLRSTKRLFSNLKQQPERLRRYRRSRVWKVGEVCQGLSDCWGYRCQEALPAHWGPLDYWIGIRMLYLWKSKFACLRHLQPPGYTSYKLSFRKVFSLSGLLSSGIVLIDVFCT